MRFIFNNQVYILDNSNKQFKICDLSVNTFDSNVTFTTLDYKKCTPALKKFINTNKIYLYGDLYKANQIQLNSPIQTSLQLFVQQDYVNFVDNQVYYVQRKIDGFHAQIYLLDEAIPFDILTTSVDETFLEKENLFECEYLDGKYYIFTILREKTESRLDMNILDNFKLCSKFIKQSLSIDFKITGQDKKSNILLVGYLEVKKKSINDWVEYFKQVLDAKTSPTIKTDGFVFYKGDKTVEDRFMYKVKPTDNTSCEFLLKWDATKSQYSIFTVGGVRDFKISNAIQYVRSEPGSGNSKLGGCEFEFKLPFYLNTMSHVYKPKLDDPLGQQALNGELDEKFCECAWHKYNDSDPYPSRIVPQKIRYEVSKISHMTTAIKCYTGSLLSFSNATKEDIIDTQSYTSAPKNYLDLYAGNEMQQKLKPTIFVYQGSSKNFLAGLKDMTSFKFVYILQDSMALQINTLLYVRNQMIQTNKGGSRKVTNTKRNKKTDPQEQPSDDVDVKTLQEDVSQNTSAKTSQEAEATSQRLALFPNWFMFKRNKLQQIITQKSPFDILRIEDSFDDLLNNIEAINTFDVISHSSKVVQIIDTQNVIKGTQFEQYIAENYKLSKTSTVDGRDIKEYVLLGSSNSGKHTGAGKKHTKRTNHKKHPVIVIDGLVW